MIPSGISITRYYTIRQNDSERKKLLSYNLILILIPRNSLFLLKSNSRKVISLAESAELTIPPG